MAQIMVEPERASTDNVAALFGLDSSDLNKPCAEEYFLSFSNHVRPWRVVFAYLLSQTDLDDVDSEQTGRSEQEKRLACLRKWKSRRGNGATLKAVIDAILSTGNVGSAEALCQIILWKKHGLSQDQPLITCTCKVNQPSESSLAMTRSNEENIKAHFAALVMSVGDAVKASSDVERIRHFLVTFFKCDLPDTTEVRKLFEAISLQNLWNYQHHSPLESVANHFLSRNQEIERSIKEYKARLSGFYLGTKLVHFIASKKLSFDDVNKESDNQQPPVLSPNQYKRLKVVLKLERRITELSLEYVHKLWCSFAEEYDIPSLTAVLERVTSGSLEIVWLIPTHFMDKIVPRSKFFRDHLIVFVSLDGQPIWDKISRDMSHVFPREPPLGPPATPLALKMCSLYVQNSLEKDKKILRHIIDHCSSCSSYREDNLRDLHSQCKDSLCGYFYWYYRHFWSRHVLHGQTIGECLECENCSKLYKWMQAHSTECLSKFTNHECCLTLCHEVKKSQHLTNLGMTDHEFMLQLEGSSNPVASRSVPSSQTYGNTSSSRRYGTSSSTDQSYSDLEDPTYVLSMPHRKSGAPTRFQGGETKKKLQPQRSLSWSKIVPGELEASIDKSRFEGPMKKAVTTRKMALEGSIESSPSPPVPKRPLQRKESDVSGKSKIVLSGRQTDSSIMKDYYGSILKFQEQHGILLDASTRDKVIGKQKKQAAAAMEWRRGTMSDVRSDIDTECLTSEISGSSPLTSGDFCELDQDLTDQDDDKKAGAGEEETQILEDTKHQLTVEEQIKLIKRRMKPLDIHMRNPPQD